MTNFEFYKDKILKLVKKDESIALKGNDLVECRETGNCYACRFYESGKSCENKKIEWLYEEYTPPKKLTKRERAYCEAVEKGWLARDRNGELYLHKEKPHKRSDDWNYDVEWSNLNPSFYPSFDFLKWEDDEPYAVEEMLKWEVEE